jgi:Holliday junction resolvase RusA-like endonuclease
LRLIIKSDSDATPASTTLIGLMSMTTSFISPAFSMTVEGKPVPKGRPRAAMIAGHATIYTPGATRAYELQLAQTAKQIWRASGRFEPLPGPLRLTVTAILPKPKRRPADWWPITASRVNPDLDNFVKISQDALNGIIFYDDAQIISLQADKKYGETPCLKIEVDRI